MKRRRVVIGVGNAYRSDDGVGLAIAEQVRTRVGDDVEVVECEQEPTRLLDAWRGAGVALVVDACSSGERPGTVHRFDVSTAPLPDRVLRSSTHAFGVGDAVELARALSRLPERVVVYGVEGADFEAGTTLSPAVESVVERVANEVVRELEREVADA
jgi:hydrogenase maturation protease